MYSITIRANSLFYYFGVCTSILCLFNLFTTIRHNDKPIVHSFKYTPNTLYDNPYTGVQHSNGVLDMDIDFEPCYNWNTNLIFAWISATYATEIKGKGKGNTNEIRNTTVTIWDNIMKRDKPNTHRVKLNNESLEYPMIDANKNLMGKSIELVLHWEHMPVVGAIIKRSEPLAVNSFPSSKITNPPFIIIEREYDYVDKEAYS